MTRTLILTRHAKSSWADPAQDDHDRPLNDRGARSAQLIGDWLRDKGHLPDQVLCSSARRTRDTLTGMGIEAATEITGDLYHVTGNQILRVLSGATGRTVLLLGHNPGIAAFAAQIVSEPPEHPRFADFPTCATLVARFDIDDWSKLAWRMGEVIDFVIPRELPG